MNPCTRRVNSSGAVKAKAPVRAKAEDGNPLHVGAPMPGSIAAVAVAAGQKVAAGDLLFTIEAMKMENVLRAERRGDRFVLNGGTVIETLRVPLRSPDFAPFLQKVRDAKPDALFTFVPSGAGSALMKQFAERGLDKAGIRMIAEGSVTDDDILNGMGDVALGVVTAHHYSAAHNSPLNKKFVEAFGKANNGMRPNFMAVGAYDGMRVIYEGAKKTKGEGGEALLNAMKGQVFESPRGPIYIDAQTRDVVHNVYVRKVEKVNGQMWNTEIQTVTDVKDPGKAQ